MTLTEFLLARIAEDETVAESFDADPRRIFERHGGTRLRWVALCGDRPWMTARSRVLAECAAKRRIVKMREGMYDDLATEMVALCHLASVYADHPDYRQEWA